MKPTFFEHLPNNLPFFSYFSNLSLFLIWPWTWPLYQGQILYRRHFQGTKAQIDSLFLAISRRLSLTQPPAPAWVARPAFSQSEFRPHKFYQVSAQSTYQTDLDDFLGPVGPTQPSPRFRANFTEPGGASHLGLVAIDDGDRIVDPFWLYPSTPWDVPMPSDAGYSTGKSRTLLFHTLSQFTINKLKYC